MPTKAGNGKSKCHIFYHLQFGRTTWNNCINCFLASDSVSVSSFVKWEFDEISGFRPVVREVSRHWGWLEKARKWLPDLLSPLQLEQIHFLCLHIGFHISKCSSAKKFWKIADLCDSISYYPLRICESPEKFLENDSGFSKTRCINQNMSLLNYRGDY